MSPPSLPTEILHEIGKMTASLPTLRTLACANRQFYAVFDRLLYQADARSPPSAAIAWAAEHGLMEILQKALSYGAEIPTTSSTGKYVTGEDQVIYGETTSYHFSNCPPPHPLCLAVQHGHVDIVELFLERGCDVDMRNSEGFPLLCLAVIHGHLHLVRTLLNRGARQDKGHFVVRHSPIQIAAFQGAEKSVLLLLDCGLDSIRPTAAQLQDAFQYALRGARRECQC